MAKRKKLSHRPPKRITSPPPGALRESLDLLERGRFLDAEQRLRSYIHNNPHDGEATHLLGISMHQSGRHLEAVPVLEQAVALSPNAAVPCNTLGEVLRITGSLTKAVAAYRLALERDPKYAQAHHNLGIALHAQGCHEPAIAAFESALKLGHDVADTANSLGVTYQAMGNHSKAIESFQRAVDTAPKHALAIHNFSTLYKDQGDFPNALALAQKACDLAPNEPMALINLADILYRLGRYDEARRPAHRATELAPRNPLCLSILEHIERASGDIESSANLLQRLSELDPNHPGIHNDLGVSLLSLGAIEQAREQFLRAMKLAPDFPVPYENYSRTKRFDATDLQWEEQLRSAMRNADAANVISAPLFFAMGKTLDDLGRYEEAFVNYETANRLVRQSFDYQADAQDEWTRDVIETYGDELIREIGGAQTETNRMIFVCGMPRSGTSLVEQILASHPQVEGAGELSHIHNLTQSIASRFAEPYPLCAARLTSQDCLEMRAEYLSHIGADRDGVMVVDKAPMNFLHLGLILSLFPEARVILCQRDPRDVCLSIYFQHFAAQNFFAYDLYEIGRFHRQYGWLVEHWTQLFPRQIMRLDYEQLVCAQRQTTEHMLAFSDLPWHDECLNFHQTKRTIQTASAWQVRQPIATRSVHRWKHYADHLTPLLSGLEMPVHTQIKP